MQTSDPSGAITACRGLENFEEIHLAGSGAVAQLETKLKSFYGMKRALCVSNAGAGLLAVALALGMREKEFITTPYTYGASLAGWLMLGNRPIFADIDPHSLCLDPLSVCRRIGPRTKAVLAVDIYGVPTDMCELRKVADDHGLWYIADAAQSLGATLRGMAASCLADALVVSFTTGKTVFAGEGGAVLTNNDPLYEKLLWHTQHPLRQKRELGLSLDNEFAVNARIHPLAAILANAGFARALTKLRRRQDRCFEIISAMNGIGLTEPIHFKRDQMLPSFFRLTAAWPGKPNESALMEKLRCAGFQMSLAPAPVRLIYRQPSFQAQYSRLQRSVQTCPCAERQAAARFCVIRKPRRERFLSGNNQDRRKRNAGPLASDTR